MGDLNLLFRLITTTLQQCSFRGKIQNRWLILSLNLATSNRLRWNSRARSAARFNDWIYHWNSTSWNRVCRFLWLILAPSNSTFMNTGWRLQWCHRHGNARCNVVYGVFDISEYSNITSKRSSNYTNSHLVLHLLKAACGAQSVIDVHQLIWRSRTSNKPV
jgi:hypothetical protein